MKIQKDVDLLPFNTFAVSALASEFVAVTSVDELKRLSPTFIIGGGANILLTHDLPGLVIKNEIKGQKIIKETNDSLILEVAAGENWHHLVMQTAKDGWSGLENLALIPGTVGAAPVQNLAAYGQNVGEVIISVTGLNLTTHKLETIAAADCHFYYRDSIFKHDLKNIFLITSVIFRLTHQNQSDTHYFGRYAYESLKDELDKVGPAPHTPFQIAQATTALRRVKMPDWTVLGTAGSFFKNPFVTKQKYEELKKELPDLQVYPVDKMLYPNPDDPVFKLTDMVKIPAARLLDELGWKGKRIGRVGTFPRHALIIINYGGATGTEILDFTKLMQEDILKHYSISLEPEVNII